MCNEAKVDETLPSVKYWESVAPTINGVLGGFSMVHNVDIAESQSFLADFQRSAGFPPGPSRALDCGCGIGRLSQYLLQSMFDTIDLAEPCQHLIDEARKRIRPQKLGVCNTVTLQNLSIEAELYDCVTVQWVCMYLTDDELTDFIRKCMKGLKNPCGFMFLKENVSNMADDMYDESDSGVTRTKQHLETIIHAAGANIRCAESQKSWFPNLLPVRMYILTP
ncbi:Methyltransferase-like protein 11A [Perkinsela sp. CCAP 1560/4]|nr:Methyltransferase-like protein 11A [Perkinsela sp. CCAP 1560/4]|eukprot:KNH01770.1 Methyltransferase-like protein 11A [Perkinsela sp. CCAP 1560/4]